MSKVNNTVNNTVNNDASFNRHLGDSIMFQPDGSPFSTIYNDIYFDTLGGGEQSEQVFIHGNNIEEQLITRNNQVLANTKDHSRQHANTFTIAETGFGTGLNFLLTLALYQRLFIKTVPSAQQKHTKKSHPHTFIPLHFISVEKHPLTKKQIQQSLKLWLPKLSNQITLLLEQYPEEQTLGEQVSLNIIDKQVTLTLIFDDATHGFSKINNHKRKAVGIVDAWYLDGFSPTKNPDMWSSALFEQIARLSKEQATLATFTIAGIVRRGLKAVGFRLYKKTITGKKKEILAAIFQQSNTSGKGYQLRPKITKPMHVTIIGGGIASACAAYALTKKGIKVILYCKDNHVAQGASSNVMGALFPLLHQQRDDISEFYEKAFWRARELYDELTENGFSYAHQWCGLLEISYKDALLKRQRQFEHNDVWSHALIHSVNEEQASQLASITLHNGGLFMPNAGWISPPELVKALLNASASTNRLTIETETKITKITAVATIKSQPLTDQQPSNKEPTNWELTTNKGTLAIGTLVICGGAESSHLNIIDELPMSPVRGQVSNMKTHITETTTSLNSLSTVICHKGYLTPAYKNVQCIGATFEKNTNDISERSVDDEFNLNMLEKCLPNIANWTLNDVSSSKARLRCVTPDHMPIVGIMPKTNEHKTVYSHLAKDKNWRYDTPQPYYENLYVLSGLGARGLCSAPLLADILAADLTGEPYPVDNTMLFNLAPNRFVIRDIIKRK